MKLEEILGKISFDSSVLNQYTQSDTFNYLENFLS
jgi:hypothetical protein